MLKFTLTTDLPKKIAKAQATLDSMPGVLQEVGQKLLSLQKLDFEKKSRGGAGADGTTWKPLAESTERKKHRKGQRKNRKRKDGTRKRRKTLIGPVPRSQIGVDTGIMRNCVTPGYKAPDGDGGNILEINGSTVTVGYQREYVPWFDEGTDRQPSRPLMPNTMPNPWENDLQTIVTDWVQDIVSKIGD